MEYENIMTGSEKYQPSPQPPQQTEIKCSEYNNYKYNKAGCDIYGDDRLKLAVYLREHVLCEVSLIKDRWFIENGTLLGAYRDHKFIPHDDDFDIGILIDDKSVINSIFNRVSKLLENTRYECRLVNTYSTKIEVYDPAIGKYILPGEKYNGSDYHFITVDLQFYEKIMGVGNKSDKNTSKQNIMYKSLYYVEPTDLIIDKDVILPLSRIKLCDEVFNAPNDIYSFLKSIYGSLDKNAKYCKETGKYIL